jgi:pSer/pThr/pTyr-binding forkhead associated (FHA) protein
VPPSGAPIDISAEVVILGRKPAADPAFPGAQLIAISDETRTVSKTHARLELRDETWFVTDLGSTNGVLFATLMGTEVEAQPGQQLEAGERFFLGDAEVRLRRSDT